MNLTKVTVTDPKTDSTKEGVLDKNAKVIYISQVKVDTLTKLGYTIKEQ